LLNAALRVVFEEGYGGLSVARVTGVARVSRRTFYEVFEDREDCFLAIFEDALGCVGERVGDAYARGGRDGGWCGGVRAALTELLGVLDGDRRLACVLVVDALGAGPRVLARRAQALEMVGRVLQRDGTRARVAAAAGGSAGEAGSSSLSLGTGLPVLSGEGVVGGVFGVLHTRLSQGRAQGGHGDRDGAGSLLELRSSLMAMIVLPYLGLEAAARDSYFSSGRRLSAGLKSPTRLAEKDGDPLADLPMRVTYRTLRVLGAIAQQPGASNRVVGELAGVADQGQISKLLSRLDGLGLVENRHRAAGAQGGRRSAGEANAWCLTARGVEVERALRVHGDHEGQGGS
jgi:AcrR family transcriptional regulator